MIRGVLERCGFWPDTPALALLVAAEVALSAGLAWARRWGSERAIAGQPGVVDVADDRRDLVGRCQPLARFPVVPQSLWKIGREASPDDITDSVDRRVDVPVLVLAGHDDKFEAPAVLAHHVIPMIPAAQLVLLDNTDHLSPLEVPDEIAGQIATFITQLSLQSKGTS